MFIKSLFLLIFSASTMFSMEVDEPWTVLVKQCNQEKFYVRFPDDPVFELENGKYHFYHQTEEAEHHLEIEKREQLEKERVFQEVMQRLENSKEIAIENVNQDKNSLEVVLSSKKENTKTIQKMIVTDQNVFTFKTQSSDFRVNDHNQFVDSFSLIS